jgi:hypothetical protein
MRQYECAHGMGSHEVDSGPRHGEQTLRAPLDMELSTIGLRNPGEVEQAIAAFAREPNGGLIVTASGFSAQARAA